jgi:hypothetical protein
MRWRADCRRGQCPRRRIGKVQNWFWEGMDGGLWKTICQVVLFWGFQIEDIRVLFMGEDWMCSQIENLALEARSPRGMSTAGATSLPEINKMGIHYMLGWRSLR